MPALLADYDWSRFDRFIDVGGAYGSVLAALMGQHPATRGVLFDLPQVVERAERVRQLSCEQRMGSGTIRVTGCTACAQDARASLRPT